MTPHKFLRQGAIVSLPDGRLLLGWGGFTRSAFPESDRPSFFLNDFFLSQETPWIHFEQYAVLAQRELLEMLSQPQEPLLKWQNPFKNRFEEEFNRLQFLFKTTGLKKAVPYVYEISPDRPSLPFHLTAALKQMDKKHLYLYGVWSASEGILGLTPEHLFQQGSGHLQTVAMAGTGTPATLWNPKNLKEHEIVIEGIVQALSPYGPLQIGKTKQVDYPLLSHLATPIALEAPLSFEQAVAALHPTPALGAAPAPIGRKWLKAYDIRHPRFYYGAPFGFKWREGGCAYVAIRNMQWSSAGTFIAAGCGVVAESELAAEWQEIELKLRAIKQGLGL